MITGNSRYETPIVHHRYNKRLSMNPNKKWFNSIHIPETINEANTSLSMSVSQPHTNTLVIPFHECF